MTTTQQTTAILKLFMGIFIRTALVVALVAGAIIVVMNFVFDSSVVILLEGDGPFGPGVYDANRGPAVLLQAVPIAGIAFLVLSIANMGSYTKPLISMGMTRTSIICANLIMNLFVAALMTAILMLTITVTVGSMTPELGRLFPEGVSVLLALKVFAVMLAIYTAGSLIAALFLKFTWWIALIAAFLVINVVPQAIALISQGGSVDSLEAFMKLSDPVTLVALIALPVYLILWVFISKRISA